MKVYIVFCIQDNKKEISAIFKNKEDAKKEADKLSDLYTIDDCFGYSKCFTTFEVVGYDVL